MAGIPDLVKLVADLATYEAAVAAGKTSPGVMYLILTEKQVYFNGELWSKAPDDSDGDDIAETLSALVETEKATASALVDLNERVSILDKNVSGETATKAELEVLIQDITKNEMAVSWALNDLNMRIKKLV